MKKNIIPRTEEQNETTVIEFLSAGEKVERPIIEFLSEDPNKRIVASGQCNDRHKCS